MKKRLISLLLTLVMLVSLCASFTVSASADAQVTTVTLNSGDTVLSLCQKMGVDYYAHKNLIMKLNGLTSEAQFSKLAVGAKIVLPVSNAAAANLAGTGAAVGTTTVPVTGTNTVTTAPVSGTTTSIPAGDYASYYLVAYTIQPGETVAGIYNNWGLSYKTYSNQILKLNNISSYNAIPAGKTLVLPTTNPAVAGGNYITIMAHVMKPGDSAYNIICSDYGLNYNSVQKQVQALNNRENLANFMVGEVLYIPVTGVVSSNTTVTPSTGSTSSSATINTSAAYNIVSQTPANGTFSLMVDGAAATSAFAGKTVEVVASPNAGYALSAITVTKVGDANTTVTVNGNKFVMPSFSVSVSVSFAQAVVSNITVDNAANGGVSALVNGMTVTSASAGNIVTIKTIPATGFMLDNVRVTYNNYRDTVAVENGQFVMPAFPVTVTAAFKEDPNYDPSRGHNIYIDALNGTVTASIGNETVSTANKGDRVTLTVTPNANYTLQSLTVYYDNFKKTVDIEKNAFTMPDGPVTVVANIKATSDAAFNITKVANADGKLSTTVDGQEVTSAKVGATVKIAGSSNKSYYNYIPTVFKTGDSAVTVPVAADGTFVMPDFPVTVTLKFYVYHNVILDASNGTNGWFNVTSVLNGMAVQKCGAGVELKVTVWGYNQNYYAPGSVILTYADGSTHTLDGSTFIMPDCDVKVRVNFNPVQKLIAHAPDNSPAGKAGNSYTVLGKTLSDSNKNTASINAGKFNTVTVTPNCALGYQVDSIYYTYTAKGTAMVSTVYVNKNVNTGKFQFEMPELEAKTSLDLYVKFKPIQNYTIAVTSNADNVGGKMGTTTPTTSIGLVSSAVEGSKITLLFHPKDGYDVDRANVKVTTASGAVVELNRNDYTFFMPAEPVTVYAPYKAVMHTVKLALAPTPEGDSLPKGVINAVVDGTKYTDNMLTAERLLPVTVKEGTVVTIINESRPGFILNSEAPILVTRVNTGLPIEVKTIDNDRFSFQMPDDDVVVTAQYQDDMYTIIAQASANGTYSVPKQAAYSETVPVVVTNISPNRGYELDKILVSYIDHNDKLHQNEPLADGTSFIPEGGGIPKSEVYFEVIFKPVLNPLTINYIFNGTHNTSANYAVDLTVDGKLVEGIQRCSFITGVPDANGNPVYQDTVNTLDANGAKTGYGIRTGSTVIISRQQFNMDKNFEIINIWVEHEGNAITPQFSNGQYYFNVPYVDSQDAADLVVNIQYGKDNDDSFNLVANKVNGDGNNATVEFKVNGSAGTIAKPTDTIEVVLTPDAVSEIAPDAVLKWVDKDGNPQQAAVTISADGSADLSNLVTSLPKSTSVTLEYTSLARGFMLTETSGSCAFIVNEQPVASGEEVTWGSIVTVICTDPDYTLSKITVKDANGNDILCNEAFMFEMPQSETTVTVELLKASYTISRIFDGNGVGNSTALIKVGETFIEDGGYISVDETVTIVPQPDANMGSVCTAVSYLEGGVETAATENGDGTWSFAMPSENTIVKVTFNKITYTLVHAHATGSPASSYTLVVDGNEYPANSTVSIGVGQNVTIKPDTGYQLSAATVKYTDVNEQPVSFGITSFLVDAEGYKYFSIPSAPKAGTNVDLELNFALKTEQVEVVDVATDSSDVPYDSDKVTAKFNGNASGAKVNSGSTVNVELKVRYDQVLDMSSVTVTYDDGSGVKTVPFKDAVKFKNFSDNGADSIYTFSFVMPKYKTSVDYEISAKDDSFNITCTDAACPTDGSVGSAVSFTPSTAVSKAVVTYRAEGVNKTINVPVDAAGDISFVIEELPWHFNNVANNVSVTLHK